MTEGLTETPTGFTRRLRESWQITYPIIVGSLATVALAVVDTAILGQYSTNALAVMGLVMPLFVVASAMIVPWGTSVQILVARWSGAEDHGRINRILDTGLLFCLAAGVAVSVVFQAFAPVMIRVVSGDDPLADSTAVLRILALCLPFAALTAHYRGVFGGLGETKIAMRVALLVNLTNIPLDLFLVFGLDLGAKGSAVGTLLATMLGAAYIVWFGKRRLDLRYRFWRRENLSEAAEMHGALWRLGWPDVTFAVLVYGADVLLVAIVASIGEEPLAGYRLMITTVTILWVVVFGCSSGISILVGQRIGAHDMDGVNAYRRAGMTLMAGLSTLVVLPPLVAPDWFFALFTPDSGVVDEAGSAVYALLIIVPAMVVAMTLAGVLRAGGDTRGLLWIGAASQLGLAVPVAWFAVQVCDLGLEGIYIGFGSGLVARAGLTYLRYRGGRWARA